MSSSDIYDDLTNCDLGATVEKLQAQNRLLLDHIGSLEKDVAKLCKKVVEMKTVQKNLEKNISELYKTAKAEIDRKDRLIADLRRQLDQKPMKRPLEVPGLFAPDQKRLKPMQYQHDARESDVMKNAYCEVVDIRGRDNGRPWVNVPGNRRSFDRSRNVPFHQYHNYNERYDKRHKNLQKERDNFRLREDIEPNDKCKPDVDTGAMSEQNKAADITDTKQPSATNVGTTGIQAKDTSKPTLHRPKIVEVTKRLFANKEIKNAVSAECFSKTQNESKNHHSKYNKMSKKTEKERDKHESADKAPKNSKFSDKVSDLDAATEICMKNNIVDVKNEQSLDGVKKEEETVSHITMDGKRDVIAMLVAVTDNSGSEVNLSHEGAIPQLNENGMAVEKSSATDRKLEETSHIQKDFTVCNMENMNTSNNNSVGSHKSQNSTRKRRRCIITLID